MLVLLNERNEVVAQGQPPADGAPGVCLRLQHDLVAGGSYRINVAVPGGSAAFGRYYLRYAAGAPAAVSTCAARRPANCAPGVSAGICSDARVARECFQGQWVCPFASLNEAECTCLGPPPQTGCTCGESGWLCPRP